MGNIISKKVEKRNNAINNIGYFAIEDIKKGETIFIRGGHLLTKDELFSSSVINSYFPISDEYFLAARTKDEEEKRLGRALNSIKLYLLKPYLELETEEEKVEGLNVLYNIIFF